jgi:transcriptional regulator with XRE-family HTH domain
MDYDKLAVQVLKAIRGKVSQNTLSEKLGFDFNQFYKWETERKVIYLKDFISICNCLLLDLMTAINRNLFLDIRKLNSHEIGYTILKIHSAKELLSSIKVSASTLSRWTSGDGDIRLSLFFEIIDLKFPGKLLPFLGGIVQLENIPLFADKVKDQEKYLHAFTEQPLYSLIMIFLMIEDYQITNKSNSSYIASKLNVDESYAEELIKEMLQRNLVTKVDNKLVHNLLELEDFEGSMNGKDRNLYFLKYAAHYFQQKQRPDSLTAFSNLLFTVSTESFKEIAELTRNYNINVRNIISKSEKPYTRACILNLQLFDPSNLEQIN